MKEKPRKNRLRQDEVIGRLMPEEGDPSTFRLSFLNDWYFLRHRHAREIPLGELRENWSEYAHLLSTAMVVGECRDDAKKTAEVWKAATDIALNALGGDEA